MNQTTQCVKGTQIVCVCVWGGVNVPLYLHYTVWAYFCVPYITFPASLHWFISILNTMTQTSCCLRVTRRKWMEWEKKRPPISPLGESAPTLQVESGLKNTTDANTTVPTQSLQGHEQTRSSDDARSSCALETSLIVSVFSTTVGQDALYPTDGFSPQSVSVLTIIFKTNQSKC